MQTHQDITMPHAASTATEAEAEAGGGGAAAVPAGQVADNRSAGQVTGRLGWVYPTQITTKY